MKLFRWACSLRGSVRAALIGGIIGALIPPAISVYYLYLVPWGAGEAAVVLCPPCIAMMEFDHMAAVGQVEMYVLIIVVNAVIWTILSILSWSIFRGAGLVYRMGKRGTGAPG